MKCCEQYAAALSAFVDGELSENEKEEVLSHVEHCQNCREYLSELMIVHTMFEEMPELDAPEGFSKRVLERVHEEKRARSRHRRAWPRVLAACFALFVITAAAWKLAPAMGSSNDSAADCNTSGNDTASAPAASGVYDISGKIHISVGEREIYRRMKEYDGVIIWDLPSGIRNQYLKHCFAHSIRCYLSPKISDVILMGSERIHLFDTPLLVAKNMGLSVEQRIMKRLLDIVVSGLGIIVASPLMLIIAACVKLYDGGPVFYLQERLTEGGKPFKICKFRSMCVDSEKNGARLASKHDSRITPVGKVLRNLHLDELPQLFNVFKGEMSLVGPRPERQTLVHEYCREIPEFYYRLKVKAGLTGYAQVYGKYNTTPYDKLKLDLFYIENYSFFLDLKLLLMTVKIFFQKEVSEGVNDNQTNALKDSAESIDVTEDKSIEK